MLGFTNGHVLVVREINALLRKKQHCILFFSTKFDEDVWLFIEGESRRTATEQKRKKKKRLYLYLLGLKSWSLQLILELIVSFSPISNTITTRNMGYLLPIHTSFLFFFLLSFLQKRENCLNEWSYGKWKE